MNQSELEQRSEDTLVTSGEAKPNMALSPQLSVYYANCTVVATTHRDISLFFGRIAPMNDGKGAQRLVELYENQIYMTLEQAEDLLEVLTQTVQGFKARHRRSDSGTEQPEELA